MNDKLTDYIKVYEEVINQASCDELIAQFEAHQKQVENYDTDLYKFNQLELNKVPELKGVTNAVANSLLPYYEDYFKSLGMSKFVELDTWEAIRIKKYERGSNQEFKTHVDVTDHASAARFAVAIVYLNDNDGHTGFPSLGVAVPPKAGRMVIFPPTWMFPHFGATPTDNDKYIMMTCLHYK